MYSQRFLEKESCVSPCTIDGSPNMDVVTMVSGKIVQYLTSTIYNHNPRMTTVNFLTIFPAAT